MISSGPVSSISLSRNHFRSAYAPMRLQCRPTDSLSWVGLRASTPIARKRNIGIIAHIDAGKTTVSERVLFYAKKIHAMHEVRGRDGQGATMDFMQQERTRGITIQSAVTHCQWRDHEIRIIDTPGHVDFNFEVERSLTALDSVVLVLDAAKGVQTQTRTVARQALHHGLPMVAFLNKMDAPGANPEKAIQSMREKLGITAQAVQLPLGLGREFSGVIDLIELQAIYFAGAQGELVRRESIPADYLTQAHAARQQLIESLGEVDEIILEKYVAEESISAEDIQAAIRRTTLSRTFVPVYLGSARHNQGVQPLLDAVTDYLPAPNEVKKSAIDLEQEETRIELNPVGDEPLVMMAFKTERRDSGSNITHCRIFQGQVSTGVRLVDPRTRKAIGVQKVYVAHANRLEPTDSAWGGDVIALTGLDFPSGTTFTDGNLRYSMTSLRIPEPVMTVAVTAKKDKRVALISALQALAKDDPSLRVTLDEESGEVRLAGRGQLHLEVNVERVRQEFGIACETSAPEISYREAISLEVPFDYTHRKQTGGHGEFAKVRGRIEPFAGDFEFVNRVSGGVIGAKYMRACEDGFRKALERGPLMKVPVTGVRVILEDGRMHDVDSSEQAFYHASWYALMEALQNSVPLLLEPQMRVGVEVPQEHQGNVSGLLSQRRGMITLSENRGVEVALEALVPLAEMFDFATALRSCTQGYGGFQMEPEGRIPVPTSLQAEIIARHARLRA